MHKVNCDPQIIDKLLNRHIDDVIPSKKELRKLLLSGKRLRFYQGFDPSSPNLHIGHMVGLLVLKKFQQLGHEVIFLIGDFTGMIGDPTGKLQARTTLTEKEVTENAKTYKKQAGLVLNFEGENPVLMKFNSQWNKKLNFADVISLSTQVTVQQMIERDMFRKRIKNNQEVFLNEFLYPLVQGYDSVAMNVDVEIGGSDQLFNMMVGRKLSKKLLNKEKLVITTPLLADNNGKKIGKSEGNAINIANPADKFYAQIMSLNDGSIMPCFRLITEVSDKQLADLEILTKKNPLKAKKALALELTKFLKGEKAAIKAQTAFENIVQSKQVPKNIPTISLQLIKPNPKNILDLFLEQKITNSKGEGRRLLMQGGVKLNNKVLDNKDILLDLQVGDIFKIGKRKWLKIIA